MNWYKEFQIKNQTTTLYELLPEGENSIPKNEVLYDFINEEDLHKPLIIKTVTDPKALLTHKGDMTVLEAFNQFANDESKELVKYYANYKPINDIIVLKNNKVLDGNHRTVASIKGGWPLRAVDIEDLTY